VRVRIVKEERPVKKHREHEHPDGTAWTQKLAYLALGGLAYYVADRLVRRRTSRHIHEHVFDAFENPPPDPAPAVPPARTVSGDEDGRRGPGSDTADVGIESPGTGA
jgi:hypothetical protein